MANIKATDLDSLLQSETWAKFQIGLGYGAENIDNVYFYHRPLFSYFYYYSPRCRLTTMAVEKLQKIRPRPVFVRVEPSNDFNFFPSQELNIKKSVNVQPAKTLVLDLTFSPDELLAAMAQKTRYNIRLAEKKGVEIVGGEEYLLDFLRLIKTTSERDNFHPHPDNYYRALAKLPEIKVSAARYQGKIIAAGLFSFYKQTATYLHGASDSLNRQLMAPYLLQWRAILQARELGCKYYDFHGIDAKKWPGVTRFKVGFGGQAVDFPGAYDIIFRPLIYFVYNFFRRLWRMSRKICWK